MDETHVVFLTALSLEYDAIRGKLAGIATRPHPAGTRFEVGWLGDSGCRAALALTGRGNHPAAVLAERAIAEFNPAALLFVGVAGALREHIALGDVVIATHIYAYHGGTSQDDGLKARPRVWETSHAIDQMARQVERTGAWRHGVAAGRRVPGLHFGPIAAGEVVQDSAISEQARWIREHYNDAAAIEMEAAGVAQAGHLNNSVPVAVVRGISDRADGSKGSTDATGWQPRAVEAAAAFAVALAVEAASLPRVAGTGASGEDLPAGERGPGQVTNIARDRAHVGIQAGVIHGGASVVMPGAPPGDLSAQLAGIRRELRRLREAREIGDADYEAATAELEAAIHALENNAPHDRKKLVIALKKLYGLVSDITSLGAKVAAIISAVR